MPSTSLTFSLFSYIIEFEYYSHILYINDSYNMLIYKVYMFIKAHNKQNKVYSSFLWSRVWNPF